MAATYDHVNKLAIALGSRDGGGHNDQLVSRDEIANTSLVLPRVGVRL